MMTSLNKIISKVPAKHWENNPNEHLIVSKIELRRNLSSFSFPHKLEKAETMQISQLISNILVSSGAFKNGFIIKWSDLSQNEQSVLLTRLCLNRSHFDQGQEQVIVVDVSGSLYCIINGEDHINLTKIFFEDNQSPALEQLLSLESILSKHLQFAHSDTFGFLTKNVNHCGNGIVVTSMLSLPIITMFDQLSECENKFIDKKICIYKKEGKSHYDTIFLFNKTSSKYKNENNILSTVMDSSALIMAKESQNLKRLSDRETDHATDVVARAFGILKHSIRLKPEEAADIVHILKLGVSMGIIAGACHTTLNRCIFCVKVISYRSNTTLDPTVIRKFIPNISLLMG